MQTSGLISKHIVLTGATSGIGRALLERLYPDNRLSVIARASSQLDHLRQEYPDARVYEADLSDISAVCDAARAIVEDGAAVDLLINNAAVQYTPRMTNDAFKLCSIQTELTVNLTAPAVLIAGLMPLLQTGDGGVILNVNSGLALAPKSSSAVYCASKGGLNTLSMALENQLSDTGVRVVQAFLPLVDTGMTAGRGNGKLSADDAAERIIDGLRTRGNTIDIGKVKLLRWLLRLAPPVARHVMRRG